MAPPRTRQFNVNLSEDEFTMLDLLAEERGVTASDFLRLLIDREYEASKHATPLERDGALAQAMIEARGRFNDVQIVPAPGDRCGGTRKLPDGSRCPGCRACC